jgi:DNA-binding transcriptional LysR family regulator
VRLIRTFSVLIGIRETAMPLFTRSLQALLVVAEELHFGRAAQRLHISQPPLSQQVRRLEAELGFALFTRSTRKVELTPAGRLLVDRAKELIGQGEAAIQAARRAARGELGALSVGFTSTAAYQVLPRAIAEFRARFPDVELSLHEQDSHRLWDALCSGHLDVALLRRNSDMTDPAIRFDLAGSEPMVLATAAGDALGRSGRVALANLAERPLVGFSGRQSAYFHGLLQSMFRRAGVTPRIVQQSLMPTILSLVEAGVGVALVPASAAGLRSGAIAYRPIVGRGSGVRAELHCARRRECTPAADAFATIVTGLERA